MQIVTRLRCTVADRVIVPPSCTNFRAFPSKVSKTCCSMSALLKSMGRVRMLSSTQNVTPINSQSAECFSQTGEKMRCADKAC